jgi:hypothetical protein
MFEKSLERPFTAPAIVVRARHQRPDDADYPQRDQSRASHPIADLHRHENVPRRARARYGAGMGDADDEDEFEPLEIVPYGVPIDGHDPEVGEGAVVRLFFQPGDHGRAPYVDIADVVILEAWDRVSIGLVRRGLTGEGPDGLNYGESLHRRAPVSLDVPLDEPLGKRPLVDAWTGEVVRRVEPGSRVAWSTETVGTPLWRRF